jgi:hypothetical protein
MKMIKDALVAAVVLAGSIGGTAGLLSEMKRPWPEVQASAPVAPLALADEAVAEEEGTTPDAVTYTIHADCPPCR